MSGIMTTTSPADCAERIEDALTALRGAIELRIEAEDATAAVERDFDVWRLETTAAMVGTENPLTAKPHSLSSAKDGIRDTADYRRWTVELDRQRLAQARARMEHEYAVELVRSARTLATLAVQP